MNEDLVAILAAVLAAVLPLVRAWIQANVTPQRIATVGALAQTVVIAAERLSFGKAGALTGEQKFDYASNALVSASRRLGVRLKPEEASAYIHAALAQLDAAFPLEAADAEAA